MTRLVVRRAQSDSAASRRPAVVKAASQLGKRAFRERARSFLAEGPQPVSAALAVPGVVTELFVTAHGRSRYRGLSDRAAEGGSPVHEISAELMAELAQTVTPQGVVAVCRFVDVSLDFLLARGPRLVAVLVSVRDPSSAGTALRTADAAGADGVVFAARSVDPYNAKCVRSSAGSLFHLPVVTGAAVPEVITALRAAGLQVLAVDGNSSQILDGADGPDLAQPTAWLFGNDGRDLPAGLPELADATVAVPIYGQADSLNLAATAAVCLYASARRSRDRR